MEIGGLGFVNTVASSIKEGSQGSPGNGFSGLFGSMLTGTNMVVENMAAKNESPNETMLELLNLLKTEDVLEMEGGLELLNQSLSTGDQEELMVVIESLLASDTSLNDLISQIEEMLEMPKTSDDEADKLKIEELIAVLEKIVSLPMKDFVQVFNGDMKDFIKAAKLFELVANEKDLKQDNSPLKDLLQQFTKKLESLMENGQKTMLLDTKQISRFEFLQKTFTAVATEVNANLAKPKASSEGNPELKSSQTVNGLLQFHQTSKVELLSLNLGQAGKPTSATDLIKQFENILARSQFSNTAGAQKLLIKLNPEHLGSLRIELIQRDAGIVAKIMTTTQLAKETLDTHLNGLKQAFGSQNIQVDRIEVSQQMTQQQNERFFNRDGQQGSQQQWQDREEQDKHNEGVEEQSFNFSLEEALVNTEVGDNNGKYD